jgi:diguanylate cyclase (GGDEF)-like protein
VAGRVLEAVRGLRLPHTNSSTSDHVTMSLGVCAALPRADTRPDDLMKIADRALYDAKSRGRNQAVLLAFQPDLHPEARP